MTVKDRKAKAPAAKAPPSKASAPGQALAPAPKAVAGRTRSDAGMRYSIELILPEDAERYLANADILDFGGSIFKAKLARYTKAMAAYRWELNGDTVVISKTGKVLDGRARLKACVDSGKPFPVILVTGIDDAAYYSLDAHSRRSTADVLRIHTLVNLKDEDRNVAEDEPDYSRIISAAWQAIAGYLNTPNREQFRYHGKAAASTEEIYVLNRSYEDSIHRSAEFVIDLKMSKILPSTVATACHYLASLVDPEQADQFFRELADPNADKKQITSALRRRYENPASNTTVTYRMAVFSKAWKQFYLEGNYDYKVDLDFKGRVERKGNLGNEAFPTIYGLDGTAGFDYDALRENLIVDGGRPVGPYDLSSYAGVTVIEMDVTPDIGTGFLGPDSVPRINRSVRLGHVKGLARMMQNRQWHSNGKTIKLSEVGDLIDGQHRCEAIKSLAGTAVSFRTLVVSGLPKQMLHTLDLGERKSLAVKLRARGDASGTQVNSICTILWRISNNVTGGEPQMVEAERLYAGDKKAIDESVAFVKGIRIRKVLDLSVAGALHLLFRQRDAAKADAFMEQLAKGINLGERSPVYMLREELNDDAKLPVKRYNSPRKVRAVIKAWNRFVTSGTSKGLKLIDPADTGFPAIEAPAAKA